jgi:hypothetical protein
LGDGQRSFITVVNSYFISPTLYIPESNFFTLWFVYMGNYFSQHREWWQNEFGFVEGTIPDGSGGETNVLFFDVAVWGIMYEFLLTGDVSLIPPCPFTSGVFALP